MQQMSEKMKWTLHALSEPIQGQILTIDRNLVIGRHQQADIVLQAAHISRRHAHLLLREDGSLWIEDLGSSNGTFVNEQRVTLQQLQHQDIINFETIVFEVVCLADTHSEPLSSTVDLGQHSIEKIVPSDAGMPTLQERGEVTVDQQGMPTHIGVPKPAPIPAHLDTASAAVNNNVEQEQIKPETTQAQQNNARVGLISVLVILILIIIAASLYIAN